MSQVESPCPEFRAWYQRLPSTVELAPAVQFLTLAKYTTSGTKFILFKDATRILCIPDSTLRDAMKRYNVEIYKEMRVAVLKAFRAVSLDVKPQASSVAVIKLRNVLSLAKRITGVPDDVVTVCGVGDSASQKPNVNVFFLF